MDSTGKGFINQPVTFVRYDIADYIPMDAGVTVPHEYLAEYDSTIFGGGTVGQERGTFMLPQWDIQLIFGGEETFTT